MDRKKLANVEIEKGLKSDIIRLSGELSRIGLDDVKDVLDRYFENTQASIVLIDLSELSFVNSEAVAYLSQLNEEFSEHGKKLHLFGAKAHVKDVIEAVGLMDALSYFDSYSELVNTIGA